MMKRSIIAIFFLSLFATLTQGQELFIMNEPASNVPKGVVGVKMMMETYKELDRRRNQTSVRVMYGLTPKLTVWAQPMVSNHHGERLPEDILSHSHNGTIAPAIQLGRKWPYLFAGVHLYAKYRFLTNDSNDGHFRMAAYAEGTAGRVQAHDEAEVNLQGDNTGIGAGIIATYLKSRTAVSLTTGWQGALTYDESVSSGAIYSMDYGNVFQYNLSFGYLLYPNKYDSYGQTNYNLYVELIGRTYQAARVARNEVVITEILNPALEGGSFVDVYLGLQQIINSNDRLELSVGLNFINRSYRHFYPVINLGYQRYLY